MATTIKTKHSTTAGNTPGSLAQGELAINVADGNLFYGDGSAVKQDFAVNQITASGDISASGTITANSFAGDGSDLTGVGTVTNVTVGTGLDVSNGTTTPNITLDLTELTIGSGLDTTATGISLDLTEVGFAGGASNKLITNDGDGTVTAESNLAFDGTTLDVNGKLDIDYSTTNTNTAVVDISNGTSTIMSTDHYTLKVAGGQANGAPSGQQKSYGGYFTAGNTNGALPDSIALYAQGHEDGAPNSYAAVFSGSAGSVVGINTLEPTAELEVAGAISASGNVHAAEFHGDGSNLTGVSGGATKMYLHANFFLSTSETSKRYVSFNNAVDQSSINNYLSQVPVMNAGSVKKISIWPQASSTSFTIGIHKNANTTAIESVTQATTAGTPITFTFSTNTFAALDEMAFSVTSNHTSNNGINMIIEFENS